MQFPPFWRGRLKSGSASLQIARFRAVVQAAQQIPLYRDTLAAIGIDTPQAVQAVRDIRGALARLQPVTYEQFLEAFPTMRSAILSGPPQGKETRSAVLLPYADARAGLQAWRNAATPAMDPYSPPLLAQASSDLYRLACAVQPARPENWQANHAVVVFSGVDAGVLTEAQRDQLWNRFEVPVFEHFVGADGRVAASECEVHAGMHIRPESAILECLDGEIVFTSLTDELHPALRVRTGLAGQIDDSVCDCGRSEPRLLQIDILIQPRAVFAVA